MGRTLSKAWWNFPVRDKLEKAEVHQRLFTHVKALEGDQQEIHQQNILNCQLYTNRDLFTFDWNDNNVVSSAPLNANLENVIQSVIDTLVSRVGNNRPKASVVVRGADFDVYLKGRQLDRYLWGEFLRQDIWTKGEKVFLDALVYGTGILKLDIDDYDGDIFSERVCPDEIVVDQRECVSCREPQQLHHRRLVSRMWLEETYGDDPVVMAAINDCQARNFQYTSWRSPAEDQVVVLESWKLPTRKGAKDGRHVIAIENCTLLAERYDRDHFPFVFFRWNEPQTGFYGRSLVEDLTGYQIRLNELNDDIREGQDVMCTPRLFVDQGSAILSSKFDTTIGRVINHRGNPPVPMTWTAFNPEIYNERDRIRQSAFEFAGVSQFSAQNKLPAQARLDSSEALREYNAIEDERFNHQAQAYEKFYIELAHYLVSLSAELYRNKDIDRRNSFRSRNLVQQIDWSEVDMEEDCYVLQISASSILNMSPAARKDKLNEWAAAGVITQEQYKAWSGEPDLERMTDLMSASHDYIEYEINKMLKGEPCTPDPFANLVEGYKTVVDTYLHLRSAVETPEDILQLFRDWMELCKEILQPTQMQSQVPAQPQPGVMDPAMVAQGMPPPEMMMGPPGPPGAPPILPPGAPTNPQTGAAVPAISTPVAQAFVS